MFPPLYHDALHTLAQLKSINTNSCILSYVFLELLSASPLTKSGKMFRKRQASVKDESSIKRNPSKAAKLLIYVYNHVKHQQRAWSNGKGFTFLLFQGQNWGF